MAVIKSLDEYYEELKKTNGFKGLELSDIPMVDESVIPENLRDYEDSRRRLHHYAILKQFLDHLNFSNDVIGRVNKIALETEIRTPAPENNNEEANNNQNGQQQQQLPSVVAAGEN